MLLALFVLSRTKYRGPVIKKVIGGARVLAYGVAVSATLGFFTVHSAAADFREQGLKLGENLTELSDLLGETTEVRLNQQSIYMSTGESDEPVSVVLDRFQANCDSHPGAMKSLLDDVVAKKALTAQGKDPNTLTTQRNDSPDKEAGTVLCMAGDGGKVDWKDAFRAFQQTGDLSNIGNLRYAYVQKTKKGVTAIRTVWTEGHFNFYAILPQDKSGDAPGSDAPNVPRPDNSRRIFTAEAANDQYAARYYETDDAPADALAAYDHKMAALGWEMITTDESAATTHWYQNQRTGEQMVFQADNKNEQSKKTWLIVATLGQIEKAPSVK
jgi:hypothetical protein